MLRKTMRVGDVRTSIKLEHEFWNYLNEVVQADPDIPTMSALINIVSNNDPHCPNLASLLRVFALLHAKERAVSAEDMLRIAQLGGGALLPILSLLPAPMFIISATDEIAWHNNGMARWMGAKNGELKLTGRQWTSLFQMSGEVGRVTSFVGIKKESTSIRIRHILPSGALTSEARVINMASAVPSTEPRYLVVLGS